MLAEGLRAGPNENSMQTLKQRFYSALIMAPLWQMKMSMAGRENNEAIKEWTGHGAWSPPPSCNPIDWGARVSCDDEGKVSKETEGGT